MSYLISAYVAAYRAANPHEDAPTVVLSGGWYRETQGGSRRTPMSADDIADRTDNLRKRAKERK